MQQPPQDLSVFPNIFFSLGISGFILISLISASYGQSPSQLIQTSHSRDKLYLLKEIVSTQASDLVPSCKENLLTENQGSPSQNTNPNSAEPQSEGSDRGRFQISGGTGNFSYGIGSLIEEPTALKGATRIPPVNAQSNRIAVISIGGHLRQQVSETQSLLLELIGDPKLLGIDLSYSNAPAFSVNVFNQRSLNPAFEEGNQEVDLPDGSSPWVHRTGGGLEYARPVSSELALAAAINYQRISVHDRAFTDNLESIDELGNQLTLSDRGQDDLLTLSLTGLLDEVEQVEETALKGTRLEVGVNQAIPIGEAQISFFRLVGNVSEFIPLKLFTSKPGTLILNFQGAVTGGDLPPYEALNLGGINSIRGFSRGEVSSGSGFIQTTAEYRFPMFSFEAFNIPVGTQGVAFLDYGSDLGTADAVIGTPGEVRDKIGDGLGYGFGIHGTTPFGLLRLELGFNDQGGGALHFTIGDRF